MGKMKNLNEGQYKPDFDIANGYINFSSELLRLSLLAIGGLGTLVLAAIENDGKNAIDFLTNPVSMLPSIVFFALCSGASLFHRYYASDCMSWYIAWIRAEEEEDPVESKKQYAGFKKTLKKSTNSLIISEYLFGAGVLSFIGAIIIMLT